MKPIRIAWIINIFALLHAAVALLCRLTGIDDQLLLTVLTMALSIILCIRIGLKIEFTAAVVIIVNILGFFLGTFGANVLRSLIHSEYIIHSLSTLITTEILGWCIVAITKIFGSIEKPDDAVKSSPYIQWILSIASGIFILRLIIVLLFTKHSFEHDIIFEMTRKVMSNSFSMVILICVNLLFVRAVATRKANSSWISTMLLYITYMILATLLEMFLVGFEDADFTLLFAISMMVQITIYSIVYMVNYAITARSEMHAEKEKANMAQYRYLKLKRQVNPHFLFNSLNILDCLICEEKAEQASLYTHKLAGIYRYMIKSEEEDIVPLRDELVFVNQYIDLLKVRFPEGFEVKIDAPEELLSRFIPPCSIQLLIENARKHNIVSKEDPLIIQVKASDGKVTVCNNIRPKVTQTPSTGLGQKYIRQLYMDISGKAIDIDRTENSYCVTLPLL